MVLLNLKSEMDFEDLRVFATNEIKLFAQLSKKHSIPPKVVKNDVTNVEMLLIEEEEVFDFTKAFKLKSVKCKLNFLEVIEKAELKIEQLKDHIIRSQTNLSETQTINASNSINSRTSNENIKEKKLSTIKEESFSDWDSKKPPIDKPLAEKSKLKIQWRDRNLLNLSQNLKENSNMFQFAHIPNNVNSYFDNRSQISRLQNATVPKHKVSVCKCTDCKFEEFMF